MPQQATVHGHDRETIRVGLIGYGLAGAAFHAPLIAAAPGMRVAAIVASNPDRSRQARVAHPDAEILADVAALWRRSADLDVVVIATPNRTHLPLALRPGRAGGAAADGGFAGWPGVGEGAG